MPKKGKKKLGKKARSSKNVASITGQSALMQQSKATMNDTGDGSGDTGGSLLLPKPLPTHIPLLGENLLHVLKSHEVEEKELHNMRISVRALQELTPQEIRDLRLVFDVFDSDLDGNLNSNEVKLALRALGFTVNADDVYKMIVELNRAVASTDFNAFLNFVIDRQGDTRDLHDEITFAFSYFDLDNNGKISLGNLKQLSRDHGIKLSDFELQQMIQEADTDGDNAVNCEEFVKIMLRTHMYS